MAHHSEAEDPDLKGMGKLFNSTTIAGRANVAKATMGGAALLFVYFKFLRSKK